MAKMLISVSRAISCARKESGKERRGEGERGGGGCERSNERSGVHQHSNQKPVEVGIS